MKKRMQIAGIVLVIILALAACQAQNTPTANPSGGAGNGGTGGNFQNSPAFETRVAGNPDLATRVASGNFGNGTGFGGRATATPSPMPTVVEQPTPTPTVITPADLAAQAVQAYTAALQKGDFSAASKQVSAFSLLQSKLTAGDIASQLTAQQQKGTAWSDFKVSDAQVFNDNTVLVHVQYTLTAPDAKTGKPVQAQKDEQWPVRLEAGSWKYNWGNVIDFQTLTVPVQQIYGLTIDPLKLTRYSDHLTMTVLAQNATNDAIVIGQPNQVLATFHFGGQAVDATNTRYIIDSMRSYSNIDISVPGLFKSYPDSVDLIQYKNYPGKPWFTFNLNG